MAFEIVRLELNAAGMVVSRRPTQPFFELRSDAMAIAEFDAARCGGDYGYDAERDCWWAGDPSGQSFRFEVFAVATERAA